MTRQDTFTEGLKGWIIPAGAACGSINSPRDVLARKPGGQGGLCLGSELGEYLPGPLQFVENWSGQCWERFQEPDRV